MLKHVILPLMAVLVLFVEQVTPFSTRFYDRRGDSRSGVRLLGMEDMVHSVPKFILEGMLIIFHQ